MVTSLAISSNLDSQQGPENQSFWFTCQRTRGCLRMRENPCEGPSLCAKASVCESCSVNKLLCVQLQPDLGRTKKKGNWITFSFLLLGLCFGPVLGSRFGPKSGVSHRRILLLPTEVLQVDLRRTSMSASVNTCFFSLCVVGTLAWEPVPASLVPAWNLAWNGSWDLAWELFPGRGHLLVGLFLGTCLGLCVLGPPSPATSALCLSSFGVLCLLFSVWLSFWLSCPSWGPARDCPRRTALLHWSKCTFVSADGMCWYTWTA